MPKESEIRHIQIDLKRQRLILFEGGRPISHYPVSTARNGPGEVRGSECTPRGVHRIRIKIGDGQPVNSVFIGRRPSGEMYTQELGAQYPDRDWILTRILWLTGCESGFNRGGSRDTLRRFIYIHGCPDTEPMGEPVSHGCIRMRNEDLLQLYGLVSGGTRVDIREGLDG